MSTDSRKQKAKKKKKEKRIVYSHCLHRVHLVTFASVNSASGFSPQNIVILNPSGQNKQAEIAAHQRAEKNKSSPCASAATKQF